jgi:ribosomal protein S18 acetylase RimI-like enzyme
MSSDDYGPFMENLIREYAADHIRSGQWSEQEGLTEAQKDVGRLLPAGRDSPGHFFFTIVSDAPGEKVGALWFALEPRGAFIYDLLVFERFRRRGFAEQAMRLLEQVAREKGARKLLLHVFGDNHGARQLYTKLGYAETNVLMAKPLD